RNLSYIMVLFSISALLFACSKDEEEPRVIERSTVTDIHGKVYKTVKIGDQWWMAENLQTRTFRNGDPLNLILGDAPNELWATEDTSACTYALDSTKGFLYNYDAVMDPRGIAPEGWRIPTDEDWKKLEAYIGMSESEVSKTAWRGTTEGELLASKNSLGWGQGSLFGKDEYGFNGQPGGVRIHDGRSNLTGEVALWWTSTPKDSLVWYRYMDSHETRVFRHYTYPTYGMSIRCIKE
ncbi:MAG: fibrobacter succinogenes major paralogous domain-containing protein, partial [Flavobacteriales bacterium]